ncbi:hypothetical protein RclHR1_05590011 [Rhizophagus clarus]|uniref:Uncharacterized protein n=1 Tax=Rhizophagus clarus TaxID=94130 RepID=A0A2Z6RN60_9GLOM|nr:hypothetical protein RclHR1_05590011 [Rhizophagus clarus]
MSNVTSSYTSVSADDNLPTAEEIKAKNRDGIEKFLSERRAELDLEDDDINKLHNQRSLSIKFKEEVSELHSRPNRVIFANNTEYLLILVLFFPASYRQTRPKNTFALS